MPLLQKVKITVTYLLTYHIKSQPIGPKASLCGGMLAQYGKQQQQRQQQRACLLEGCYKAFSEVMVSTKPSAIINSCMLNNINKLI